MKKIKISLALLNLFLIIFIPSKAQTFEWAKHLPGSGFEDYPVIEVDGMGDVWIGGIYSDSLWVGDSLFTISPDSQDFFVAKFSATGQFLFARHYQGRLASIAADESDNLLLTGLFKETRQIGDSNFTSAGQNDIFLAKISSAGNFLWARHVHGPGSESTSSIATGPSGNVYVTGTFSDTLNIDGNQYTSSGFFDFFLLKFDSQDFSLWGLTSSNNSSSYAFGGKVAVGPNDDPIIGGIFYGQLNIGGATFNLIGAEDIFLVRFDSLGNYELAIHDGGSSLDDLVDLDLDATGNIYYAGNFTTATTVGGQNLSAGSGNTHLFLAKYNQSGSFDWVIENEISTYAFPTGISSDDFGRTYICGAFSGNIKLVDTILSASGQQGYFLAEFLSNGTRAQTITIDQPVRVLSSDQLRNPYVAGFLSNTVQVGDSTFTGDAQDFWLAKYGSNIVNRSKDLITEVTVFPNPISDKLHLRFDNFLRPELILVFDNHGRLVMKNTPKTDIENTCTLDFTDLPTGFYILNIQTQDGRTLRKKVLKN